MEVPLANDISADQSLLDFYRAKVSYSEQAVKTAKAGYFPELNLGYFNQQIDQVRGFQGLVAEAHFPLWFRPKAKAVKQAKVLHELSINEYRFANLVIDTQYDNWKRKFSQYMNLYQEYGQSWDEQIKSIVKNARYQMDEGEINYLEYMLLYVSAMETKLRQLDLIYNINESIIQLEYYQNQQP